MISMLFLCFLVALASGVLGCFVLWNKMANYSDGASHAGVLGLAIAHALHFDSHPPFVCLAISAFALIIYFFSKSRVQSYDTLVAAVSKGMAAVGVVIMVIVGGGHTDHEIGEVFLGANDHIAPVYLYIIYPSTILMIWWMWYRRKQWMLVMINSDLAKVEGVRALRVKLEIGFIVTAYIILLVDIIGIIMVAATLVIPAAAARYVCSNYKSMVAASSIISVFSVLAGYFLSMQFAVPIGAASGAILLAIFLLLGVLQSVRSE